MKNLEEERKILSKIKDGTYQLNLKPHKTIYGKFLDSPAPEPQTGKLHPGKKLLSIFEIQSGPSQT